MDEWIVRTLHVSPQLPEGEWIEWPVHHSPVDAEWRARAAMENFPGVVTDYKIIRRHTEVTETVWGRYGDEYSRG